MPIVHFLNVEDGDCSIIQHVSERVTVIDVCNARPITILERILASSRASDAALEKGINGNFCQKKYPVNPILYMKDREIQKVWRYIQTHPDMDHMDGIKAFFEAFKPDNFWDTENHKECPFATGDLSNGYDKQDWDFYQKLRDGNCSPAANRLVLYANATGKYWNVNEDGQSGADGLYVLAPTPELVKAAIKADDYNDSSYVLLYKTANNRVLFAGDSHDDTWEYILKNFRADVANVDILIAPHHGRHSDRDWEFLDVVNPSLTLFGNAPSEHMAYAAWNNRGLPFITNNQAGNIILNVGVSPAEVYVTGAGFAKQLNPNTTYSSAYRAYYAGTVRIRKAAAAAG
jgi:beta-lactamase superfamily II metal-dependent hydrolase